MNRDMLDIQEQLNRSLNMQAEVIEFRPQKRVRFLRLRVWWSNLLMFWGDVLDENPFALPLFWRKR